MERTSAHGQKGAAGSGSSGGTVRWRWWLVMGSVLLGLCVMPLPADWREGWKALWLNASHWPVAAAVSFGWLSWRRKTASWAGMLEAVLLVSVAGAGAEVLQLFTGRTFDGHDVWVNGLGACGGALIYACRWWGIGWLPLALVTSVPAWWPLVERVQLDQKQKDWLPVIGESGNREVAGLWKMEVAGLGRRGADDLVLPQIAGTRTSLRRPGYGGDWSDYAGIGSEYWFEGDEATELGLRIDGEKGRLNGAVKLQRGHRRFWLRFGGETGDAAVLRNVKQLVWFFPAGSSEGRLEFGKIRLYRESEMMGSVETAAEQ